MISAIYGNVFCMPIIPAAAAKMLGCLRILFFFPMRCARMFTIRETSQSDKIYAYIGSMTKILKHHPVYAFIDAKVGSDYDNRACTFSHSSRVNVYWSIETWACRFWFVCARCLWGRCREESIIIGMWSWLLERLWKSHRAMIKNSVRASLEPHHSGCLYKGTERWPISAAYGLPCPQNTCGKTEQQDMN